MLARRSYLFIVSVVGLSWAAFAQDQPLRLWYQEPARQWEEALPLGNGRLGMMPDGGVDREIIVFNDITLWSGGPQDANNYEAATHLPLIRSLLREGKNEEAGVLVNKHFVCKGQGSGHGNGANVPFGCYQVLGSLQLDFVYPTADDVLPTQYRRSLDIRTAVASTEYMKGGVKYTRTYLTSFGTDVAVIHLEADVPGKLNFTISLSRPERFSVLAHDEVLTMYGQLNNGTDGKGMQYTAKVKPVLTAGGRLRMEHGRLVVEEATVVTLYISAATSYQGTNHKVVADSLLSAAVQNDAASLLNEHTHAYRRLFDRVDFALGGTSKDFLPTDQRLKHFAHHPASDNGLAVLFFQFGRYLSISSTRVGLLPPNLQGLWAHQIQTPWNGDYHLDVNVQMNHWHLEVTNLPELNLPLAQLVHGLVKPGTQTARAYYNADGWVAHVITNIWGFTAPGEDASWGVTNAGSGWLCNNLWEHFAFTRDTAYLADIYPILKGSAQFYHSVLMKDPGTGWLVTAPSVSPENSFFLPGKRRTSICMGPVIDHQITRELFSNVIAAAAILGIDDHFSEKLRTTLGQLPPAGRIGSDGRLMEWLVEYEETDPRHRHISHLYGLFPGALITPDATPGLADACRKTLEARGDDSPGWSKAYKVLFWARLHDGNRAYKLLTELLKPTSDTHINYGEGGGSYPNLLSAGPPFQIDGNFGGTAGIAEMLLQSHQGYIHLLPALPDAWKDAGEIMGLKARGNFTVNMQWREGKVVWYEIYAANGGTVNVKVNGQLVEATVKQTL